MVPFPYGTWKRPEHDGRYLYGSTIGPEVPPRVYNRMVTALMTHPSYPHLPRPKIQPGGEKHLRQVPPVQVPSIEQEPLRYLALALVHLRNEISKLPAMIEDHSRPVDEYRPQELVPDSELTMTLQPQWETEERITSIIVTGPAGSIALQLGDRTWNLTIPATGILVIGPISLFLSRSDARILTAQTPGQYTLELMGYCDTRGQLI